MNNNLSDDNIVSSKIQKETLNKEETIINHKKTIEKIKNNASKHYVFNITGDALTLELNTTTEGKNETKKFTTRGMQQQVLRTLVRDGGYGLYHRYIENNSSLNDPEFIKHNNNIIGDICFKFKQEKKGLLDRLLTKTQKERDEMSSKQEYVYILVPLELLSILFKISPFLLLRFPLYTGIKINNSLLFKSLAFKTNSVNIP